VEHLERHRAIVLQVVSEEDGRHPAAAQLALQTIALGQRRAETGIGVRQRGAQWWGDKARLRITAGFG
jgi:hypothetical protein